MCVAVWARIGSRNGVHVECSVSADQHNIVSPVFHRTSRVWYGRWFSWQNVTVGTAIVG